MIPRGVLPPLITPLLGDDQLDAASLERLVEHVLAGGVHGLFLLGTTGEGPSLSRRLRQEMIERTCRQVGKRVPVLVCISDTSRVESLRIAAGAADAGADAAVAAAPYYAPATQAELQQYFADLATACPLPLLLYNMPSLTKVRIEPETVRRAMDHPRIVGLKDSSAHLGYLHQVLRLRGSRTEWRVFVGDEETLAYAIQAGADGGVNGGANVFPKLLVRFYEAAHEGDRVRMERLRALVVRLGDLYRIGQPHACSGIKGVKCALSLKGICHDLLAAPLQPFEEPEKASVRRFLDEVSHDIASLVDHRGVN